MDIGGLWGVLFVYNPWAMFFLFFRKYTSVSKSSMLLKQLYPHCHEENEDICSVTELNVTFKNNNKQDWSLNHCWTLLMCHNMPCVCICKSENRVLTCFHYTHRWVTCPLRWRDLREKQEWKTRCSTSDSSPGVRGPSLTLIKTGLIFSNLLHPVLTFLPLLPDHVHAFSDR